MSVDPRLKPYIDPQSKVLDLRGLDLSGVDLSFANLEGALLMGASLRGARLQGAQLFGAQLNRADLTDASLVGANLAFAHLQGALLVRTDLRDSILEKASLERAVVRDIQLSGARVSTLSGSFFHTQPRRGWLVLRDGWCCRTFDWRDHLNDHGSDREVVIALHGMTGSGLDFHWLASQLERPLISLDLFGHGETLCCPADEELSILGGDKEPQAPSFDQLLTLTERWITELILRHIPPHQKIEILGYSMGGRLALSLIERWSTQPNSELLNRVRRLSLIGVNPGLESPKDRSQRATGDERWAQRMQSEGLEAVLHDWNAQPILAHLGRARPELMSTLEARRLKQSGVGLACAMRAGSVAQMPPLWERLEHIKTPTQWIAGALDHKYVEIGSRAASLQGECAERHVIADSGHSPHLEQPEAVARLLCAD